MTYMLMHTVPYYTGVPEDVITNTWHFEWLGGGDPTPTQLLACIVNVQLFYAGAYSGTGGAGNWAQYVNLTGGSMKMYNLDDPKPRVPVYTYNGTTAGAKDTSPTLPTEVACVLSYHTEYQSGIPKASQRGRIYLGGLGNGWLGAGGASSFPVLTASARNQVANVATALCAASLVDQWGWVVYSPKLDQQFAVAGGWIDNAFDTQRRRGQAATLRQLWTD